MSKKHFIIVFSFLLLLTFISCQKGNEDAKEFSNLYLPLKAKLKTMREEVKTRDQYVAFKAELKREYESLLKKFEQSPANEAMEVLRARILLHLGNTDDAMKKIDQVLLDKPEHEVTAKMVKVQILFDQEKFSDAYETFKDIETQITEPEDLLDAYYYFATEHNDNAVKKNYADKFLSLKKLPKDFTEKKADIYFSLAAIAKEEPDFQKARKLLTQGVASTTDEGTKKYLTACIDQLDYYGQAAFPVTAEDWLNSESLNLLNLRGKPVILAFWAPWCPSCRKLMPSLVEMYEQNKDSGLTVIGLTRLYGNYRDNITDAGKVTKEEEIEHIKKYLERNKIRYPIAVTNDKSIGAAYKISAIPTLVFIDKQGNIDFTSIGSGSVDFIKAKIKKLLDEG